MGTVIRTVAALLVTVWAGAGQAQEMATGPDPAMQVPEESYRVDPPKRSPWRATIGVGGAYGPEYLGGDGYEVTVLPWVDITYKSSFFLNTREGLGLRVRTSRNVEVGGALGYARGREADDADALTGMGDIDPALRFNLFGTYRFGPVSVSGRATYQMIEADGLYAGNESGYKLDLSAAYTERLYRTMMGSLSLSTTWADSAIMETYFGVTTAQSAVTPYGVYRPGAGFQDVALNVTIVEKFSRRWGLVWLASYKQLLMDAADSPLTQSAGQLFGGVALTYTF